MKNAQLTMEKDLEQQQSSGGTNANENANFKYSTEPIDETPFVIFGNEEGYRLGMGMNIISKHYQTKEEIIEKIGVLDWEMLTTVIAIISDKIIDNKIAETKGENK